MNFSLRRRRMLQALGYGAGAAVIGGDHSRALAGPVAPPRRVVFILTGHGHVWKNWHMQPPSLADGVAGTGSLLDVARAEDMSPTLRPFHAVRDRILAVEGLAHTSVLGELATHAGRTDVDLNNHNLAMAHLLSPRLALQRGPGVTCVGGGISIDQEIGRTATLPGMLRAPVWGANHYLPYSYLEPGVASPREADPVLAFADVMGAYHPPVMTTPTREDLIERERASVLDVAGRELDSWIGQVGPAAARKLSAHRDLVRDFELAARRESMSTCDPTWSAVGHQLTQFLDLAAIALSCDMARVITIVPEILRTDEFGFPADRDVHGNYAHSAVDDGGEPFSAESERAMTEYNAFYAEKIAAFVAQLDRIPETDGTLLDHTAVVWLTELGSPTHQHKDACTLVAGGSEFFRLGNYHRFARTIPSPSPWFSQPDERIGPSLNQLFVTLLRFMGRDDETFGDAVAASPHGEVSLSGTLRELHV